LPVSVPSTQPLVIPTSFPTIFPTYIYHSFFVLSFKFNIQFF
jgi:hypothetical protein